MALSLHHLQSLGKLSLLPQELRDLIYILVLTSSSKHWATFGRKSGVKIDLLCTSRQIYKEARSVLFTTRHTIVDGKFGFDYWNNMPIPEVLHKMERIVYCLHYATANRGDCEVRIREFDWLFGRVIFIVLLLRESSALKELRIDLLNTAQAKSGPKRLRAPEVRNSMRKLLKPFACLPEMRVLQVGGYDAIEYTEMFSKLRQDFLCGDVGPSEFLRECENV